MATPTERTPAFILAGESHSVLNNITREQTFLEAASDIVTKAIPLSMASGTNQLYTAASTIADWGGVNLPKLDFDNKVREYDDDLSKYYQEHKQGIDVGGFLASSMVPGMAGVKALRWGQEVLHSALSTGKFGNNVGKALGMRAPTRDKYLGEAIKSIRETGNIFKITEANTLKALAAGVGQQALEGAAFTTVVNATMYKTPILEDRDVGDLAHDVLIGAALGGAVGGLLVGVSTVSRIKKAGIAAEKELTPWAVQVAPIDSWKPSDKIRHYAQQLDELPPVPTEGDLVARATRTAEATRSSLMLKIREELGNLTSGDKALAQSLHDYVKVTPMASNVDNYLNVSNVARINRTSETEKELSRISAKLKKADYDHAQLTEEEFATYTSSRVSFIKLRGEGAGSVTDTRPGILNLADYLKPGEGISLTKSGVQVGKKPYANNNNPYRPFNIMGVSHLRVEARYAWAELLPKWADDPLGKTVPTVHATDIPLLQKAYKDGITKLSVIPESGVIADSIMLTTVGQIDDFLKRQKIDIAARLSKAETMPTDVNTFIDKVKGLFGINFNVVSGSGAAKFNGFFARVESSIAGMAVEADAIAFSKNSILHRSLASNVATLKHEEGHAIFQALLDSHGINKTNLNTMLPKLVEEIRAVSKKQRPSLWTSKDPTMIAYRNGAHELFADAFAWLSKNPAALNKYPEMNAFAGHLIRPIPQEVIDAVAKRAAKPTSAEIAKIVDMEESALNGTIRDGGFFARDKARADYADMLKKAGGRAGEQVVSDVHTLPTYAKVITNVAKIRDVNGMLVDAVTDLKVLAKLYEESAARVTAKYLGEELPELTTRELLSGGGAGPTMLAFEGANYGTRGSTAAYVGQRAHQLIQKAKTATSEMFTPTLMKAGNDINATMEFSMVNETIRNMPGKWHYDDVQMALVYQGTDAISLGINPVLPIKSPITQQWVKDHIKRNGERLEPLGLIRANEGLPDNRDPLAFYPIPRNPKDTPFFAFVIDDTVTGVGHSKMIYAKDGETLEAMANKIRQEFPEYKVLSKGDSEEYFKAHGTYEFERTIHDNYINNALARKGISSSLLPTSDPKKVITDFMDWHLHRDSSLVRELISHRYAPQMNTLRAMAEPAIKAAKSKFGYVSPQAYAENAVNTPASNLMKMMLDIQKIEEYPFWSSMNKMLDSKVSQVADSVSKMWNETTHPDQLVKINKALTDAGYGGPYIDSALYNAMNGTVPRGALIDFVAKANALVGSLALRMDPFNALNNLVGHAVKYGTESKAVIAAIESGNAEAVGELAKLAKIRLPGTDNYILSPTKLFANAVGRYHDPVLRAYYKEKGFITSISEQYDQVLDAIAIRAGDTAKTLEGRVATAMEKARGIGNTGERLTGNKFAEEFNRFVAADTMKQITDVAVKHGIMDEAIALTYINTFVNRTQGNFLASQRPLIFQGPVGQAIGLFQTYQFNLIQQMLRHIGDGNGKSAATMMGLQATVYGLNGLPGFNAMNTYIVGNAPGNTLHTDLYQSIMSGAGKEAGEWITYGALSNAFGLFHQDLKTNMYSRGDVNPRSLTIVPTDPAKIPIFQAASRFYANMKDSISQVGMGADVWNTTLRAIEHNGISRPLAGMAQVLGSMVNEHGQVVSTSQQGNLLMAHDLNNLASGVRVLGGRPLDEAMVNDKMFRNNTYRSHDSAKRAALSEAIKTTVLSGREPSEDEINNFAGTYAKYGGKQSEFTQYMARQYKNASVSQAEQLRRNLSSPYSSQMQLIMGGEDGE